MPTSRQAWQTKARRANPIPGQVRSEVVARSGGRCEAGASDQCTGRCDHLHHRLRRSQGGKHTAVNLLACCERCHAHIHDHPAEAFVEGWLIRGVR